MAQRFVDLELEPLTIENVEKRFACILARAENLQEKGDFLKDMDVFLGNAVSSLEKQEKRECEDKLALLKSNLPANRAEKLSFFAKSYIGEGNMTKKTCIPSTYTFEEENSCAACGNPEKEAFSLCHVGKGCVHFPHFCATCLSEILKLTESHHIPDLKCEKCDVKFSIADIPVSITKKESNFYCVIIKDFLNKTSSSTSLSTYDKRRLSPLLSWLTSRTLLEIHHLNVTLTPDETKKIFILATELSTKVKQEIESVSEREPKKGETVELKGKNIEKTAKKEISSSSSNSRKTSSSASRKSKQGQSEKKRKRHGEVINIHITPTPTPPLTTNAASTPSKRRHQPPAPTTPAAAVSSRDPRLQSRKRKADELKSTEEKTLEGLKELDEFLQGFNPNVNLIEANDGVPRTIDDNDNHLSPLLHQDLNDDNEFFSSNVSENNFQSILAEFIPN